MGGSRRGLSRKGNAEEVLHHRGGHTFPKGATRVANSRHNMGYVWYVSNWDRAENRVINDHWGHTITIVMYSTLHLFGRAWDWLAWLRSALCMGVYPAGWPNRPFVIIEKVE